MELLPLLRLACFMYKYNSLQAGQVLREHFIITKYLKKDVNDDLSICVDQCHPSGLSITGDIKLYQCHVIKR